MTPDFLLRPLRASDIDRVAQLEGELFGASAWSYAMISAEIGAPGRWYVVAEYDSKDQAGGDLVMGYAGLWFDGDVAQIMTVGVSTAARRQGVGRLLMNALIDRAAQLRANGLLLEVAVNNTAAITLYESFGFKTISVRKRYYQPENVDAFVMRRDVSAAGAHAVTNPAGFAAAQAAEDAGAAQDSLESYALESFGPRAQVFVTAHELVERLEDRQSQPAALLDVRWQLGRDDGAEQYAQGHIPGAVYVDLETELASSAPNLGRHPLPAPDQLAAAVGRWGIMPGQEVVVYDAVSGMSAARAWWLLRWAGLKNVRILDGGLDAWTRAGGTLEQGVQVPPATNPTISTGHMPTMNIDQAGEFPLDGFLIDARAGERFRGETEPIDPRAGHIPGALNIPTASLLNTDGTFKSAVDLRQIYEQAGVLEDTEALGEGEWPIPAADVGVYCGSGVTACHEIAVLASLGIDATLFPGSWSQWSNDQSRIAATGE